MTHRQRTLFFGLFARACEAQGIYGEQARDAFRHELIARVLPLSGGSLRNIGKGRYFDKLMAELSRLAQSAEASAHFATAEGRRWAYFIEAAARQVCELKRVSDALAVSRQRSAVSPRSATEEFTTGAVCVSPSATQSVRRAKRALTANGCQLSAGEHSEPIAYIKGILVQAKWHWALAARGGAWWLDLTQVHEEKLFQMLDTHRRRLLRAIPLEKSEADGTRMRAGFDPDAAYRRVGTRLVRVVGTTEPAVLHCEFGLVVDNFPSPPGGARTKNQAVARSRTALQSRRNRPPLTPLERCSKQGAGRAKPSC